MSTAKSSLTSVAAGANVATLQIRLTSENEKLLGTFRELCRLVLPTYNEKESSIVNGMFQEKVKQEIDRLRKKKP